MLPVIFVLISCVALALGGSLCPPRENIYPCSCANIHQSKTIIHTIVNCHRIPDADTLTAIFPALRTMQIDQFHLYDSFWEANKLGVTGESKRHLPTDWLTLLKIKEVEIVDTALSQCFACQWKLACRNSVTNRFTLVNSSSHEQFCSLCETSTKNKYPWTACLSKLRQFHFSFGRLTSLGADFFPVAMNELTLVNLTHNQIASIDGRAFNGVKRMTILDLSHNALEHVDFITQNLNLEFLDLSWNNIKTIGATMFDNLKILKKLMLDSNSIVELKESEWKKKPESLTYVDINDNPLHCDCNIRWINSTFHINALVLGTCATPEEYENSLLRKASRFLIQRCDEDGNIGTRLRTTPKYFV